MSLYDTWALGVLKGVSAPANATNLDTLWAWSGAESGLDRMRWNNPLNTTQPEGSGNQDANSVGVKIYPTVQQGITATVITLLNGRYPTIVSHLRNSVSRQQWGDACGELGTWGTGCAWINAEYGGRGGILLPPELTPDEHDTLMHLFDGFFWRQNGGADAWARAAQANEQAMVASIPAAAPADLSALAAKVDAIEAAITRIETALKGA